MLNFILINKLKCILIYLNLIPYKTFNQNFLIDTNVISRITYSLKLIKKDIILEIGSGIGMLTSKILKSNIKKFIGIEIDTRMNFILNRIKRTENSKIFYIDIFDFLKYKIIQLYRYKIISNLPYNISIILLFNLIKYISFIIYIIILIQKEIAIKIMLKKRNCKISMLINSFFICEWLFDIDSNSFFPRPKVVSTLIKLTPYF